MLLPGARASFQFSVLNVERMVDLQVFGGHIQPLLPAAFREALSQRELFVEHESSALTLSRYQRMLTALLNGAQQLNRGDARASSPARYPALLVYAPSVTASAAAELHRVEGSSTLYAKVANLEVHVVDTGAIPHDSQDVHLKLLHAIAGDTSEVREQRYLELIRLAQKHASLPLDQLEAFAMSTGIHHLDQPIGPENDPYARFRGKTWSQIWAESAQEKEKELRAELRAEIIKAEEKAAEAEERAQQAEEENLRLRKLLGI